MYEKFKYHHNIYVSRLVEINQKKKTKKLANLLYEMYK